MSDVPRTVIELKDHDGGADVPRHKVAHVLINGTEVDVDKENIEVTCGGDGCTVVTLRLIPTELKFTH